MFFSTTISVIVLGDLKEKKENDLKEKREDGELWYCGHLMSEIVECVYHHEGIINQNDLISVIKL